MKGLTIPIRMLRILTGLFIIACLGTLIEVVQLTPDQMFAAIPYILMKLIALAVLIGFQYGSYRLVNFIHAKYGKVTDVKPPLKSVWSL